MYAVEDEEGTNLIPCFTKMAASVVSRRAFE